MVSAIFEEQNKETFGNKMVSVISKQKVWRLKEIQRFRQFHLARWPLGHDILFIRIWRPTPPHFLILTLIPIRNPSESTLEASTSFSFNF